MFWKRPDSVPYPTTWTTFVGKKYPDMEPLEYRIQDLSEELIEDVIVHFTRYFFIRENTCSVSGFIEDETSVKEMQQLWRDCMKQKMSLVALVKDPKTGEDKIAGANVTFVIHKSEKNNDFAFEGQHLKKIWRLLKDLESQVDVFEKFNVDIYLAALGLSVGTAYHGDNVAYELLMARSKLCRATGVPLTVTSFTGPASQHIASKVEFITIADINYETYVQDGKIAFPKLKGYLQLMFKEINENTDNPITNNC